MLTMPSQLNERRTLRLAAAALAATALLGSAKAASVTWNDAGPTNFWGTGAGDTNWTGGTTWTNGNDATFAGVGETITLNTNSMTAGTVGFNASGYTIDFGTNAMTWGTLAGTGGFTKTGTGTLTLSNASTASGTVNVAGGRIELGNASALGTTSVNLTNGGNLYRDAIETLGNAINVGTGGGTITGRLALINYLTLSNTLSGAGPLTINGLVDIRNAPAYSGTISLTLTTGATELVLGQGGVMTTPAVIQINSGATFRTTNNVTVGGLMGVGSIRNSTGILTVNAAAGGNYTASGAFNQVDMTGSGTQTMTGSGYVRNVNGGTLILNASNMVQGTVTVNNGGTLRIMYAANGSAWGTRHSDVITVNGGGTLNFSEAPTGGGGYTYYLGTINLDSANGNAANVTGPGATRAGYNNGNFTLTSSGAVANNFAGGIELTSGGFTANITTNSGNTLNLSGRLFDFSGLTGMPINKLGVGTLAVSGSNSFAGAVTVSAGTLRLGHASALGTSAGGVSVTSGAVLDLNGQAIAGEAMTLNGTGISSGGALANTSGTAASWSGSISLNSASSIGGSGDTTVSGAITGASSLTKVGAGKLTLTNAGNTYSGTTVVNGGTLKLDGSGVVASSLIDVQAGTFDVSSVTGGYTLAAGKTLKGSGAVGGNVTVAAGGSITGGNGTSGVLTFTNSLTFTSSGTINIGTLSNYTTSTAVNVLGTLTLNGTAGQVTLSLPSGAMATGTYRLIGTSFSTLTAFTVLEPGKSSRQSTSLQNLGSSIDYVVAGDTPVWTGSGGSAWNYTATDNWKLIAGNSPTTFQSTDVVLFNDGATATTVDIDAATVLPVSVEFNNSTRNYTLQGSYGIGGAAVFTKLGTGTLTITNSSTFTGGSTIGAGEVMAGTAAALGTGTVTLNGGSLKLNGVTMTNPIALGGGSLGGTGTFGGVVSGGSALVYNNAGNTLTLSGSNTYSAGTTLAGGTLRIGHNSALGTGGLALNGGTLDIGNYTIGNGITLGGGTLVFNGATISGGVAGGASYPLSVSSNLTLSGSNSYTGGTTVSSATLTVSSVSGLGAGAVNVNGGTLSVGAAVSGVGATTLNAGMISGAGSLSASSYVVKSGTISAALSGAGALTKDTTGAVTLSGNSAGYSGSTTLSDGLVKVGHNSALGTGGLALNGGSLSSDSTTARTLGNAVTIGGTVTLGDATNNGSLSFTSTVGLGGAARTLLTSSEVTMSGVVSNGSIVKQGAGTLNLSAANTFSAIAINSGTVRVTTAQGDGTSNSALGSTTSQITVSNGATLNFDTGASGYYFGGSNAATGNGKQLGIGTGGGIIRSTGDVVVRNNMLAGSGDLTKTGTGMLTFLGNNSQWSGNLIIQQGAFAVYNTDTAFGSGTGTIQMNDGTSIADQFAAITFARNINVISGQAAFYANAGTMTVNGVISGSGGVAADSYIASYAGTSAIVLGGSNTFKGNIAVGNNNGAGGTVAGRLLRITGRLGADTANTYAGNGSIASGATLEFANADGATTQTLTGIISGSGTLLKSGASTLVLAGTSVYTGPTTITGGTLTLGGAGTLGNGNYGSSISNAGTLNVATSANQTLGGVVSGIGALMKGGAGTLTLSGTSTYTGATTISGGTFELAGAGLLGSGSYGGAISNAGALLVNTTANQTLGGVVSGAGGLVKANSGTLTLNNANTFSGTTTVNAGTLVLNYNSGGTGSLQAPITVNSGGTVVLAKANALGWSGTWVRTVNVNGGTVRTDVNGDNGWDITWNLAGGTMSATNDGYYGVNGTGGIYVTGDVASTISGRLSLRGQVLFDVADGLSAGDLVVSGTIFDGSGADGIRKTGAGTLTLTANNTYAGATTVSAGTLAVSGAGSIASSAVASIASGAVLDVSNITSSTASVGGLAGAGTVANGSKVLRSVVASGTSTFGGTISGAGGLVKDGAGTLALTGTSTLAGGITLAQGTLSFAGGSLGSTGTIALGNLTTLRWEPDNTQDISARLALPDGGIATLDVDKNNVTLSSAFPSGGFGSLVKAGAGTLTLTGTPGYTGMTTITAGTLAIAGAGGFASNAPVNVGSGVLDISGAGGLVNVGLLLGSGSVNLGGKTLRSDVVVSGQFDGVIGGAGGFTKAGAETLTFSAAQSFSGRLTVEAGTLSLYQAETSAFFPNASAIIVGTAPGSGAVLDASYYDAIGGISIVNGQKLGGYGTVSGNVTLEPGARVAPGGSVGTLAVNGTMTFSGTSGYVFEVSNAGGTKGTGWDLLTASSLTILSSTSNPFVISLTSLTNPGDTLPGPMTTGTGGNWDPDAGYQWLFVDTGSTIAPFAAGTFTFDFTNFQNTLNPNGTFDVVRGDAIGQSDTDLYIVYAAVPEPGTLALAAIGLAGLACAAARRRTPRVAG